MQLDPSTAKKTRREREKESNQQRSSLRGGQRRLLDQRVEPSRRVLLRLATYLPPHANRLAAAIVCMILATALNLGYGWFAKKFIDTISEFIAGDVTIAGATAYLNFYVGLVIVVFIAKGALFYGQRYCIGNVAQRISMRLRNEIFAHLQTLSMSFFDNRKTGQLMSGILNDVPTIQNSFTTTTVQIIGAPLMFLGGIGLLFFLNWKLALVSIICLPAIHKIIIVASKRVEAYTTDLLRGRADISQRIEEAVSGIRVVKAFGNEAHEIKRFQRHSQDVFRAKMRAIRVRAGMLPLIELISAIGITLVMWVGGREILAGGGLEIGDLAYFIIVLQQVAGAARSFGDVRTDLAVATAAGERVFAILDTEPDIKDQPEALQLDITDGRVEFHHVSFSYIGGLPVLDDIHFTMEPNEVVALVGPTGAGKSTIANLILRFYDPTDGAIRIDGADIRDVTTASLRRHMAVVPQDAAVFPGTVKENIAYGRLDATEAEIIAAAKVANAHEFIERLDHGYDTVVGDRGSRLSGGQRQRLAIARAILRDPRILILDEATSSLDSHSEARVQEALRRLMACRTTLVIAHRLSTIRDAHRIVVLRDGEIVENGAHDELMAENGLYAELYRTQFRQPRRREGLPDEPLAE